MYSTPWSKRTRSEITDFMKCWSQKRQDVMPSPSPACPLYRLQNFFQWFLLYKGPRTSFCLGHALCSGMGWSYLVKQSRGTIGLERVAELHSLTPCSVMDLSCNRSLFSSFFLPVVLPLWSIRERNEHQFVWRDLSHIYFGEGLSQKQAAKEM